MAESTLIGRKKVMEEKIKQLVNPLEKIDYIIVDGYVLVQLKRNHFDMILNSDNIDWEQTIELIKKSKISTPKMNIITNTYMYILFF